MESFSLRDQLEVSVLTVLLSGAGQKLQCLAVTRGLSCRLSPSFPVMLSLCAQLQVRAHSVVLREDSREACEHVTMHLRFKPPRVLTSICPTAGHTCRNQRENRL